MKNRSIFAILCFLLFGIRIFAQGPPPPPPPPPPPDHQPEVYKKTDLSKTPPISKRLGKSIEAKYKKGMTRLQGSNTYFYIDQTYKETAPRQFKKADDDWVLFNEFPRAYPFSFMADSIKKRFEAESISFNFEHRYTVNGKKAVFLESIDEISGSSLGISFMELEKNYVLAVFSYDINKKKQTQNVLLVLESICTNPHATRLDPLDEFDFTVDTTVSGYGSILLSPNTAMFSTPTGLQQGIMTFEPRFKLMQTDVTSPDSARAVIDHLISAVSISKNTSTNLVDKTRFKVNGMDVVCEEYNLTSNTLTMECRIMIALIVSPNAGIIFIGSSYRDHEKYREIWLKTIGSIRQKG